MYSAVEGGEESNVARPTELKFVFHDLENTPDIMVLFGRYSAGVQV